MAVADRRVGDAQALRDMRLCNGARYPVGVRMAAQGDRIRAIRDEHEADMLARLTARPPAAFVFLDGAPLLSGGDAWSDFETHCQASAAWVSRRYGESARFGHDHVWLRRDVGPAVAP